MSVRNKHNTRINTTTTKREFVCAREKERSQYVAIDQSSSGLALIGVGRPFASVPVTAVCKHSRNCANTAFTTAAGKGGWFRCQIRGEFSTGHSILDERRSIGRSGSVTRIRPVSVHQGRASQTCPMSDSDPNPFKVVLSK